MSHIINKTIYMTYHSPLPAFVMSRWHENNRDYMFDFSMDADCISFLETAFSRNIAELFKYIPRGMYKADLWRICKLYIHGGVYADIDLVPHLTISALDDDVTFYSCLSMGAQFMFQAFMKQSRAKSPLILGCLVSFLMNKPYKDIHNGPCSDMYHFILYNVRHTESAGHGSSVDRLETHKRYTIPQIKIPVFIPTNEDFVSLHYFPDDIEYSISISSDTQNADVLANKENYRFYIRDHTLFMETTTATATATTEDESTTATDDEQGVIVDICFDLPEDEPEVIFLFEECIRTPRDISTCYIKHQDKNIMDCRDVRYVRDKGWAIPTPPTLSTMLFS